MNFGERLKLGLSVRGVRTMLVVDFLSIAAFFVTLALILRFAEDKLAQQADWIAKNHAEEVQNTIETRLNTFMQTADAFVAGYLEEFGTVQDGEKVYSVFSADEDNLKQHYDMEGLMDVMKAGMDFIPDCSSIVMVYEPGLLADEPDRGVATVLRRNSDDYIDLLDDHDIFNHRLYKRGSELGHSYLTTVGKVSEDSILVVTYVVPLYSKDDGHVLGQFWFDLRLDQITSMIRDVDIPYDSAYVVLVDQYEKVIASNHPQLNGMTLKKYVWWVNYGVENEQQYEFLVSALGSDKGELSFGMDDGNEYRLYHTYLPSLQYTLFTIILDSSVYSDIREIKKSLLWVSILGVLLMLIFTWYAFVSFSKAARARMQADSEFALATQIQSAFLPKTIPSVPGVDVAHRYVSAREVGGDLYDFFFRDGKFFFCVGDVSGKGVSAAMLMSVISSQFHNAVRFEDNPSVIMSHLNDSLAERADAMMFCTMLIAVYDTETRVLECCNAGHPRPLKLAGSDVSFLEFKTNVPIGIFMGYGYENDRMVMSKGDKLLVYTDGITEARSVDRSFYGEERLMDAVKDMGTCSPTEIIDTLTRSVSEFQSGAGQADDIASVCIGFS